MSQTIDPQLAGNIFFSVCLLVTGALTLRRRGIALSIAAVLGVMQLFLWWFSPWAAKWYAGYVGLPLRDNLMDAAPVLPSGIPMFMLGVAVVIEALLLLGRKQNWSGRWMPQAVGAVAAYWSASPCSSRPPWSAAAVAAVGEAAVRWASPAPPRAPSSPTPFSGW
ncbi:hypothetical protein ABZ372_52825 [Streptomyces sp. NPDC005921]|uniref:hypothetical protein n=1 Tax=Streptomyces sp. NPDC005827 TaxID=3157070 RepID=UPI003403B68F